MCVCVGGVMGNVFVVIFLPWDNLYLREVWGGFSAPGVTGCERLCRDVCAPSVRVNAARFPVCVHRSVHMHIHSHSLASSCTVSESLRILGLNTWSVFPKNKDIALSNQNTVIQFWEIKIVMILSSKK